MLKQLVCLALATLVSTATAAPEIKSSAARAKALKARGVVSRVQQSVGNGILAVDVEGTTGQFTVNTGPQHPQPNRSVLFPIGTSYITLRDGSGDGAVDLTNDGPNGGLVNAQTTTVPLGTTGLVTAYTLAHWKIYQDVIVNGTSLLDTNVQHTVKIKNISTAPRSFGVRFMWDWMIADSDNSLFRTRLPDGNFISNFQTFNSPAFNAYEEIDNLTAPTYSIFGSVRDLPLNPPPTAPDQLRYSDWSTSSAFPWDFTNTGGGSDSSVCYYWGMPNALTLAPGATAYFTQYITTEFAAIARPTLTVTKTAPASVNTANNLTYTFTVNNAGTAPATGIVLRDTIPAGTSYVSSTGGTGTTFAGGIFSTNIADLAIGQTRTATMTVRVNAPSGNVVNGTYSVDSIEADPVPGPAVTTSIIPLPTPTPTPRPTPTPTPLPTPGPLTGRIAFMSQRDANHEIYIMNGNGTGQTRLTNSVTEDDYPNISADGRNIAFTSKRNGHFDIYTMRNDGTVQTRLTTNAAIDTMPQFSPDGQRIVFASNRMGNYDIWVMDADGANQTQLTTAGTTDDHPSFTADGTKIAFRAARGANHDIWIMNADGTGQTRLTTSAGIDMNPTCSRRSPLIAFQSERVGGQYDIYTMNLDGTNQKRVTTASTTEVMPCFSPDGTRLGFASTRGGGDNEICTNGLAGEPGVLTTQLTANFANDTMPSWSVTPSVGNIGSLAIRSLSSVELSSATAEVKSGSISLEFTAPLGADNASFAVEVNGRAVGVESATANGASINLKLAGPLRKGDAVMVRWQGLLDEDGATLAGITGPLAAK